MHSEKGLWQKLSLFLHIFWYDRSYSGRTGPSHFGPMFEQLEYRNLPSISFSAPIAIPVTSVSTVAADLNGDGNLDLITTSYENDPNTTILLGDGHGNFKTAQVLNTNVGGPTTTGGAVIADFNGDGIPDLVTSTRGYVIATSHYVSFLSIYLGHGDGTFGQARMITTNGASGSAAAVDLNNDGHTDLVVNGGSYVGILLGNGDGTFQPEQDFDTGASLGQTLTVADFNRDGIPDIAVRKSFNSFDSPDYVAVYLGKGDGTFGGQHIFETGEGAGAVVAADLNGDGIPDLVVANGAEIFPAASQPPEYCSVSVLLGNGDGTFQPTKFYSVGTNPDQIAISDFNGDGIPDLAVTNSGDGTVSILQGNGDGTFQPQQTIDVGSNAYSVVAGDFNNDKKPDLVVCDLSPVLLLNSPLEARFTSPGTMHKLLYANQNENVPITLTNGYDHPVKGKVIFYLSTNQNQGVAGDEELKTKGNPSSVTVPTGGTSTLPQAPSVLAAVIPTGIHPGTYYLKAAFILVGESMPEMSAVAVSPALKVAVNYKGQATIFANATTTAIYERAVDAAKSPQGPPNVTTISSEDDIKTFIEDNEALNLHVYPDQGVPAIGYGSDLKDMTTGKVNATFEAIIKQYLATNPEYHGKHLVIFTDFLNPKNKWATIDEATAGQLFEAGFQAAENDVMGTFTGLTLQEEAALIDLVYNVGTTGLTKFKSMVADINQGDFASAGLELINSLRTTQVPEKRTDADYYLLTAGHYDEL
jgi:GH24 family phage-related lysozyme (muramidase)